MSSQRTVRDLQEADLDVVWGLLERIYTAPDYPIGGAWTRSLVEQQLSSGYGLGCVEGGQLLALILYDRIPAGAWEITMLATQPHFRRKGAMKHLLQHLLALRPPKTELWLEVHEGNLAALKLYASMGAMTIGRRRAYYRDQRDALLLAWPAP